MAEVFKNLDTSVVATAPSPATSGTSLTLFTGDGANWPTLAAGDWCYATVSPSRPPALGVAEIVKVTARAGDVLTIVRGASPRTIVAGDLIWQAVTAESMQNFLQLGGGTLTKDSASSSDNLDLVLQHFRNGQGTLARILGQSARGTAAAPRRTKDGDILLRLGGLGFQAVDDSTTATSVTAPKAQIDFLAADDWTSTSQPTKGAIRATPLGSTSALLIAGWDGGGFYFKGRPWVDLMHPDFNTSGSTTTTTGSITSGTASLVVASATGYRVGMGIYVVGAGAAGATLETYILTIAGTTFTLNSNAGSTVSGAVTGHSDARAVQAAIDYLATNFTGGVVFVPNAQYYVSQFKMKPLVQLWGTGRLSNFIAIPGNTATYMAVTNAVTDTGFGMRDVAFDGNKASGATCGGIGYDHGGQAQIVEDARHANLYITNCKGDGIHLTNFGQSFWSWIEIDACDGVNLYLDKDAGLRATSDQQFSQCMIGNAGLEGIIDTGADCMYTSVSAFWSGRLTPKPNWSLRGQGGVLAGCRADDGYLDAIDINGGTFYNLNYSAVANNGAYLKLSGSARSNTVNGVCTFSPHRTATSIVNVASSGGGNVVNMTYEEITSLPAGVNPLAGTADPQDTITFYTIGRVKSFDSIYTQPGLHQFLNVSQSIVTTTGSVTSGSPTLTLASVSSFMSGQGVYVMNDDLTTNEYLIQSISGLVVTLTTNAVKTATAREVGHVETVAFNNWFDTFGASGAGKAVLGQGNFNVGALKISGKTWFQGQGTATILFALPGYVGGYLISAKTPSADYAYQVSDMILNGRNASSPNAASIVPTCGGILQDSTGLVAQDKQIRFKNLNISYFGADGWRGINADTTYLESVYLSYNLGYGMVFDPNSTDCFIQTCSVINSGLHNIWDAGAGNRFSNTKSDGAGQVNNTTNGDCVYLTGSLTQMDLACMVQRGKRHGVHIDGATRCLLGAVSDSMSAAHFRVTAGSNNTIVGRTGTSTFFSATSILDMAGGTANTIRIDYDPASLAAWAVPAIGAGLDDPSNLIMMGGGNQYQVFLQQNPQLLYGPLTMPDDAVWFFGEGPVMTFVND